MILHIVRKDARLLWIAVIMVTVVHLLNAALQLILDPYFEPVELRVFGALFPLVTFFSMALLITMAMHQDAIPGVRQDWLVRPIRRRDLLLAKVVFVVTFVHGPLFLVDVGQTLLTGFSLSDSLGAALTRGLTLFCMLSLPIMMIASVTEKAIETMIGSALLLMSFVFLTIIAQNAGLAPWPMADWGAGWILSTIWLAFVVVGAAALLPLQFFRRRTMLSRAAIAGLAIGIMMSAFIPWRAGFAVQELFSVDVSARKNVAVTYDSTAGRMHRNSPPPAKGAVYLPLHVAGLTSKALLLAERAQIRVTKRDGTVVHDDFRALPLSDAQSDQRVEIRQGNNSNDLTAYQPLYLSPKESAAVKDEPVEVEIDYAFTIMAPGTTDTIPALDADTATTSGWRCKTKFDDDGDEVEAGCLKTGEAPSCTSAVLENSTTGLRNEEIHYCHPFNSPYEPHFMPDPMSRLRWSLAFFDRQTNTPYPVDRSQLSSSRIAVTTYRAVDHFRRHLGSGLIGHSQKMTVAAMQIADMKVWAHRS